MGSKVLAVTRFLEKLRPDPQSECIVFDGALNEKGYGRMRIPVAFHDEFDTRFIRAHRFAYHVLRAPIVSDAVLDHLCGTKDCCNPYHLDAVSVRTNAQRAVVTRETGLSSEEQAREYLYQEVDIW